MGGTEERENGKGKGENSFVHRLNVVFFFLFFEISFSLRDLREAERERERETCELRSQRSVGRREGISCEAKPFFSLPSRGVDLA